MVLLKVYPESVALFPFEGDPPWTVDGERETHRHALKPVQPPPGRAQFLEVLRHV
jgi:hypothetical protein